MLGAFDGFRDIGLFECLSTPRHSSLYLFRIITARAGFGNQLSGHYAATDARVVALFDRPPTETTPFCACSYFVPTSVKSVCVCVAGTEPAVRVSRRHHLQQTFVWRHQVV